MGNDKSKASRAPPPKAQQPVVSKTVDQTSKVKATISRLEQRQQFLEKKIENELKQAKLKNSKKDKQGALQHLKRKKAYEKETTKLHTAIMNLEQQVMAIESASVTQDVVSAMKVGQKAQEAVMAGVDVDDIQDIQDNIADLQARQEEVEDVLGQPLNDNIDMAELEEEFAELEADGIEDELSKLPAAPTSNSVDMLPDAPSHAPASAVADDDDAALMELAAEMAA